MLPRGPANTNPLYKKYTSHSEQPAETNVNNAADSFRDIALVARYRGMELCICRVVFVNVYDEPRPGASPDVGSGAVLAIPEVDSDGNVVRDHKT